MSRTPASQHDAPVRDMTLLRGALTVAALVTIVFVSALEARHAVLMHVQAAGVLTVGETPEFVREGGHARFYVENNFIRIEIDAAGADRAGPQDRFETAQPREALSCAPRACATVRTRTVGAPAGGRRRRLIPRKSPESAPITKSCARRDSCCRNTEDLLNTEITSVVSRKEQALSRTAAAI